MFWSLKTDTKDLAAWKNGLVNFITHMKKRGTRYFYTEGIIQEMLFSHDFKKSKDTKYIKYSSSLKYYPDDKKIFTIKTIDSEIDVEIPYKEVINFIEDPLSKIIVEGDINEFKMEERVYDLTDSNEREYLSENPGTTDGSILRVKALKNIYNSVYECKLERSTYFKQVRTNLSLDLPLKIDHEATLRSYDLADDSNLPDFEKSIMVNSIGVSSVVYFRDKETGERRFFLKPRKGKRVDDGAGNLSGTGVFQDMLGTISGVAQMPSGHKVDSLVAYATSEMIREFNREAGLEEGENPVKQIVPLAFVRELARGGKPQFFFLIEIEQLSNGAFKNLFRNSIEGIEEFDDSFLKNHVLYSSMMSPEIASNLFYAFSYFESRKGLSGDKFDYS